MSTENVIEIRGLHKSFRNGRDKVLQGIDLDFPKGTLTYILGPSGTGKSVLIKHILGLLHPDQGEIRVYGKNLADIPDRDLAEHRKVYGMLFQNSALFDDRSIFENVAFPLREHTRLTEEEITKKVNNTLSHLGLKGRYDKLPNELSGGMKKRVGLARAIIREPSILLYDEPTTGLDPVTRTTVDSLIEQMKRELQLTSVVISHDIPSALLLADHIAFLNQGKVAFYGTPAEFRKCDHPLVMAFLEAEQRTVKALVQ
ncbi:MAG: ABC transporter ATP-binding protein [Bdellovibrionaceae bacterium]|nr:ABC transporter ATP-binding protein [Pseudobdellovibrionaceae bacterium]|tara:strand:- start:674 stop:1444 length:771 start_codon:yes stop_codon:yes gene_type:complete